MKSNIIKSISGLLLLLCVLVISSCQKWLDVKPEDKFLEENLFQTDQGFKDALNGLYIKMADNSLYGERLSLVMPEVLAQAYYVRADNSYYQLSMYNYADESTKALIEDIWVQMYSSIANVNQFIKNCDTYGKNISQANLNQYKGEALGLRAYLYLDLLRMYAPSFALDSLAETIPYYTEVSNKVEPYSPSNKVMVNILSDLDNAELLLKDDPAVSQTTVSRGNVTGRTSRNYKMNYYAVKALKARAYLWKGDKVNALKVAKEIIAVQTKFPWVVPTDLTDPSISNRIFSTELIFALENPKLNDVFTRNFSPNLTDANILAPGTAGTTLSAIYEGLDNDYRYKYTYTWKIESPKTYYTFFKYQDSPNSAYSFNRTVPMIRKGEIYLIAAEASTNATEALSYINALRNNRNISSISTVTATDILKEYRKEFFGEGQLWYYHKRLRNTNILYTLYNFELPINESYFTFPLPLAETSLR